MRLRSRLHLILWHHNDWKWKRRNRGRQIRDCCRETSSPQSSSRVIMLVKNYTSPRSRNIPWHIRYYMVIIVFLPPMYIYRVCVLRSWSHHERVVGSNIGNMRNYPSTAKVTKPPTHTTQQTRITNSDGKWNYCCKAVEKKSSSENNWGYVRSQNQQFVSANSYQQTISFE